MTELTFSDFEREGWDRNAEDYSDVVLPATRQAFIPLLDSLGDLSGKRVLEVACGTGHLAQAAVARGADVTGIDAAAKMVDLARRRVPAAQFQLGDGEDLPFDDGAFDAVLCSFGLLHMAHPDRAMAEAARVLKRGGAYGFTTWQDPARGCVFLGIIHDALSAHADMDVGLPPGPPMFLLADAGVRDPLLRAAGFSAISEVELEIVWPLQGAQTILDFIERGAVRAGMLFDRQTPETQIRIRDALVAEVEPYLQQENKGIAAPALLVTATRA